ncbi:MAG TPA: radical SAM protein [Phycisphaerae bacterium]|jgi:MoaA/NifB/PqqE/SkfB family radical SAM enzyme|nr:radical SAM protein [Phycisphaerae bacterium]HOJ56861.1 radical SAM protein [Phycisphaerae bacterium]HOL28470.1 radical SAM protein [Phycisphaerae bacterium]HPP22973.1 radical SAM protein [Phycisphaerae bacterium]
MNPTIRGICQKCQARVPAEHVIRNGAVFLRKNCPDCGSTEALLTSDAVGWQQKRDLWHFEQSNGCSLNCKTCHKSHQPNVVLLDVTNRCNMNCPICIASVPKMGFDFHPPLEYFDKVFRALAQCNPVPMVEFFGGEPTLRDDLFMLVTLARKHGLKPRLITNGLRLADEEFCRQICETRIRVRLAFDGRHPDIYKRLRRVDVYDKKMKALENLKKYSTRTHVLLACVARGINDQYLEDLVRCCHENREVIDSLGLIPLTENWEPGEFETGVHTTREDVEKMVQERIPGGKIEFVPAGIGEHLRRSRAFFRASSRSETLMFGGVHPDCESVTALISDGQQYVSINHWLRMPFSRLAEEILLRSRTLEPKLARLDPTRRIQRLRGQWLVLKAFLPLAWRALDLRKLFKGHPLVSGLRMLGGLLCGRKLRDVAYAHMNPPQILQLAVLPFEEPHSVESSRLQNCTAVFAYEDVTDGQIKTIPACLWYTYRNDILRQVAAKYGTAPGRGEWVEWGGMRFQIPDPGKLAN